MKCKLPGHHIDQSTNSYFTINLKSNNTICPESIQTTLKTYCSSKSINEIKLRADQVIVRSSLDQQQLPSFGDKMKDKQSKFTYFPL